MGIRLRMIMVICAASAVIVSPAFAELSAEEAVLRYRAKDAMLNMYINGIGNGFSWANAELINSTGRPLFCQPDGLVLTVDQEVDIVSRYIKRIPANGKFDLGGVMLAALRDAFPCPKPK